MLCAAAAAARQRLGGSLATAVAGVAAVDAGVEAERRRRIEVVSGCVSSGDTYLVYRAFHRGHHTEIGVRPRVRQKIDRE